LRHSHKGGGESTIISRMQNRKWLYERKQVAESIETNVWLDIVKRSRARWRRAAMKTVPTVRRISAGGRHRLAEVF